MEIIRKIQAHYGLEYSFEGFKQRRNVYSKIFPPENRYSIDILDNRKVWSHGNVHKILFNLRKCEWSIVVTYPNWPNESPSVITFSCEEETHSSIADSETKLLCCNSESSNTLVKNTPIEYTRRVTCYISSTKQTLKKEHHWILGRQLRNGDIRVSSRLRYLKGIVTYKNKAPYVQETYIAFPSSDQVRDGNQNVKAFFERQNQLIYEQVKKQVEYEKKERKKVMQQIKQHNTVILNKYTLLFLKSKPHMVQKSCIAWKKGWVNKYGKPVSWQLSKPILTKFVLRTMSSYLGGKDTIRLALTNRKHHFELLNPTFLSSQNQYFKKCADDNVSKLDHCLKKRITNDENIHALCNSQRQLPNISNVMTIRQELENTIKQFITTQQDCVKEISQRFRMRQLFDEKITQCKNYL